jgi:Winged helix DNA-binding domain
MDIAKRRLRNQYLAGPGLDGPAEVVRHLGAVQAQDYRGAMWAIAQRCGQRTAAGIETVVAAGSVLRTHVLRPTWHFVAAADIRWMLALTGPRVLAGTAARHRELELDRATFARSHAALESSLAGGMAMTRAEVAATLTAEGVRLDGQRLVHILLEAELAGLICSGPPLGRAQTHVLLEERIPPAPAMEPDEAAAELATRYFVSHGPARLDDFTWWSSLTVAQARRGIEAAGERLATELVDGRPIWFSPTEPAGTTSSPLVRLLPNYDEYLVAYRERADYYDRALDPLVFRDGVMANVVTVDGRAVGNWSRRPKGHAIDVVVEPWVEFDDATWDLIAAEVENLERHLECPAVLEPRRR